MGRKGDAVPRLSEIHWSGTIEPASRWGEHPQLPGLKEENAH